MLKKNLLLGIVFLLVFLVFYYRLYTFLTLEALRLYHLSLQEWTDKHFALATFLYNISFILLIACAIPAATVLTVLGGFLFGNIAIVYAIACTTMGGSILYYSVKRSVGGRMSLKKNPWLAKVEAGLKKNAFNYILMLRLVPIFPCWISNIGAGILNVPYKTFLIATVIGIAPSTIIYGLAGSGLEELLLIPDASLSTIINKPAILFPLIGLAILVVIPLIYKSFSKNE